MFGPHQIDLIDGHNMAFCFELKNQSTAWSPFTRAKGQFFAQNSQGTTEIHHQIETSVEIKKKSTENCVYFLEWKKFLKNIHWLIDSKQYFSHRWIRQYSKAVELDTLPYGLFVWNKVATAKCLLYKVCKQWNQIAWNVFAPKTMLSFHHRSFHHRS